MIKFKRCIAVCMSLVCVLSGCGVTEGYDPAVVSSNSAAAEDTVEKPTDPKDDFYRYVNGEKLANAEFEYGSSVYNGVMEKNLVEDQVKAIIREVAAGSGYEKGSEEDIIKTVYDLFSEYDFDTAGVPAEIDNFLHEIDNAGTLDELLELDAKMQREYGVTNIFNAVVANDFYSSGRKILTFDQYTGILDVDFSSLEDSFGGLNSLKDMGSAVMRAMGHDDNTANESGVAFGMMMMDLYNATDMDIVGTQTPYTYIKTYTADEIDEIITNADIRAYFEKIGVDPEGLDRFACVDTEQLSGINKMLTEENLEALKIWRMSALASKYRRFLAVGYKDMEKYRAVDYASPEDQVMNEIMQTYEETDVLYVEKHYTKEMDDALLAMCEEIREGYRGLINQAKWLSETTRSGLLEKLDNIVFVTGMDRKRHDPSEYIDVCGNDYFEYYKSYVVHNVKRKIASLTEPVDRKNVAMAMQMVNACYDPSLNNVTITVAITNPPFFDVNADHYTNLGGLGAVIGHEMGHAFDSNGIIFDKNGVYDPNWISATDMETLNERNEKAVRYFEDDFTIFGVYHVDGEKTLGENFADLGGLECVLSLASDDAQKKNIFENYAATWCEKIVDESLLGQLDSDEHSPNYIRVNAIVSTIDDFYKVYGVSEGDGMYIPKEERISRWY